MTTQRMRLEVTQFDDIDHWRWSLSDDGGAFKADHRVALARDAPEYDAFVNLYHHIQRKKVPDRPLDSEREIVERLGRWLGEQVLGPIGPKLIAAAPVTVEVRLPTQAAGLLYRPFELAHVHDRPLAVQDVTLVYEMSEAVAATRKQAIAARLRMLAVFSLPSDVSALNLRRERHALKTLIRTMVQTKKRAIELRILQYGVTRERLEAVLEEGEGWDLMHFSGHGLPAGLLLEQADGSKDPISTEDLQKLLRGARERLKLVTLSACESAAPTLRETLQWLYIDAAPRAGAPPAATKEAPTTEKNLPALAKNLAETLDCAVLAMRYPVGDDFAIELAQQFYDLLLAKQNDLPRALQRALPKALPAHPHPGASPISVTVPALFGARATDLILAAPLRGKSAVETAMACFPPESEYFVGRVGPMARASMAMAEASDRTGVLFYGMAGAGKTASALELAYRYEHDRFEHFVWHRAPEEGRDIETALSALAHDMERQIPEFSMAHVIDRVEAFADWLPTLSERLEQQSMLIVLDNLESLLTERGRWRDARWGQLIEALLLHDGFSRTLLTSRRHPTGLGQSETRLQVEPIHALSRDEATLLARQLPHLGGLLRGETALEIEAGRALVKRTLAVVQGHPKLLAFAEAQAEDPKTLAAHLDHAESAWTGSEGQLQTFFREGASTYAAQDFLQALGGWTRSIAAALSQSAQTLFYALCALEEADRAEWIVEASWENLWQALEPSGQPPELQTLLDELRAAGLVEVLASEGESRGFNLHPGVAEAGRGAAGDALQAKVDEVMGALWRVLFDQASEQETGGLGVWVREAPLHAAPYLMRQKEWYTAGALLDRVMTRDRSPTTATRLLPWLRQIAAATEGTKEGLYGAFYVARALNYIGQVTEAEAQFREVIKNAERQGEYRLASSVAGDLFNLLRNAGRYEDALALVEEMKEYTQRAGLGPWTQLCDKGQRLQILNDMGENEAVLKAVEELREEMHGLPAQSDQEETVTPAAVREFIYDSGQSAARDLRLWEQALEFNAERLQSMEHRSAPAREWAWSRYNDYYPTLMLSDDDEQLRIPLLMCAGELLQQCREMFEQEHNFQMLGQVFGALADLEDRLGHPQQALSFQKTALRYGYVAGDPGSCTASHYNLSLWLERLDEAPEVVLAHTLAAALLEFQMGSGGLAQSLLRLNNLIAALGPNPPLPGSFDQLAGIVEQVEGVRFRELFGRLPQRVASGDEALAAVLSMAAEAIEEADEQKTLESGGE